MNMNNRIQSFDEFCNESKRGLVFGSKDELMDHIARLIIEENRITLKKLSTILVHNMDEMIKWNLNARDFQEIIKMMITQSWDFRLRDLRNFY